MAWVESTSASFRARHESSEADDAARVLDSLERTRARLDDRLGSTVPDVTVVLHRSEPFLGLAHPLYLLARAVAVPAGRRYVAGWAGVREIHVLSPAALARRASRVPGSGAMLALAPDALYAGLVVARLGGSFPPPHTPARGLRAARWAWLAAGAGRFLAGQTAHARPAIARRLREGSRPAFPPGVRDAALLGGTVLDLLAREEGERAVVDLVTRPLPPTREAGLRAAFGGRPLVHVEGAWRAHLATLAGDASRPREDEHLEGRRRRSRDRR